MSRPGELKISVKTFISTVIILFAIMLLAGVLTRVLPMGEYERATDGETGAVSVVSGSYRVLDETERARLPIWRWFTAPVEVLFDENAATAIAIIVFILLVGGAFAVLDKAGVLQAVVAAAIRKVGSEGKRRYYLIAALSFICMLLGSTMGLLEETIPLVPIIVSLSLSLGYDTLLGLGMSIMAVGFGFAAGTFNPFTVGVAQNLAGVPLFSGLWLRLIVFVIIYALLVFFLIRYAKRIEKDPTRSLMYASDEAKRKSGDFTADASLQAPASVIRAARAFGITLIAVFAYVVVSLFVPALSGYSMVVMALLMPIGALIAGRISGYEKPSKMLKDFLGGLVAIAPSVLLILLAMSVKHIVVSGGVLDTILYAANSALNGVSPFGAILLVYLIVLVLQFFISSASSKVFLIMPLICPLADMIGLTRQQVVLAFCFGDGFTNVLFPTCALLLIALGLVDVPYGKWLKFAWKIQLVILFITAALLLFAVSIGYR